MRVNLDFFSSYRLGFSLIKLEQIINYIFRLVNFSGRGTVELTLAVVGDREMKRLNRKFRGKNKTTTVLSFPGKVKGFIDCEKDLGEIVISYDQCRVLARRRGTSIKKEFLFLLVHGLLHLLGYDHLKKKEAERMERLEKKILARLYEKFI